MTGVLQRDGCVGPAPVPRWHDRARGAGVAVMSLDPTGTARKGWTNRMVTALNAFDMTLNGRVFARRK